VKRRWFLALGLAIAGFAAGALLATYWGSDSDSADPAASPDEAVVHGIVESVGGDRWNRAYGAPPADGAVGRIYRVATIRVLDAGAGPISSGTIEVAVDGGTVGNVSHTPGYGAPELFPGDEVVVFLAAAEGEDESHPGWQVRTNWIVDPESGIATAQYRNEEPLPLPDLLARATADSD
jgi:hypothetical protein